jgi:thioredoxin reductase
VRYNTSVVRIARGSGGGSRWAISAADGSRWACHYLVYAGGLAQPVPLPSVNGSRAVAEGLVLTYASAPADAEWYAGKRVLILGHGNAAFEFADALLGRTALVHVSGRPHSRVALALETHYPGNVRALHATLLESYNLKSLDGITSAPLERLEFAAVGAAAGSCGGRRVAVSVANGTGCTRDAWGRSTGRCSLRRPYDAVIACLGWRFDASAFEADVRPVLAANGKHPAISPRFESANVPGLFFAGALAHANDFKRASGGFIHGFRYTARALHRFLEEEEAALGAAQADWAAGEAAGVVPEDVAPTAAASEAQLAPEGAAALGEGGAAPLRASPRRSPAPPPRAVARQPHLLPAQPRGACAAAPERRRGALPDVWRPVRRLRAGRPAAGGRRGLRRAGARPARSDGRPARFL